MFTPKIDWNDKKIFKLKELLLEGLTVTEMAEKMSKDFSEHFSYRKVESAIRRYGKKWILDFRLEKDSEIKTYKELTLPMDNYMISCDHHAPYFSELWVNRKLAIANKFRIKKNIEIGDVWDFDFVSKYPKFDGQKPADIDKEIYHTDPLIKALDYFDKIIVLRGNHEWRVSRFTDSRIQAKHLYGIFGAEIWKKKFKYSVYDKIGIGKNWMAFHPKSYSQIATSVAKRLAEKFHKNVINSHGHLVGMTYDRSGEFLCVDLGGMFDKKKIGYINLQTTAHPTWKNGFGMFYNDHFYHFTEETDWQWWLR